ncbi:TonB-dependent receptor [Fulvivirgaceae bacterium BMA12]|uniref:TonB-dependent receptor n=1 Tax=Agaribacillus aureus TaxID=3051825 RepID=A0ABT8LHZ3_9BACT|nr:TonB-dependent receptor [Fulvivirgaceae bacterium BMA12]
MGTLFTEFLRFKWLAFMLLILALTFHAYGQSVVTGTVTNAENGEQLPGVNVLIKGTTKGTVTNVNGKYSIEVGNAKALIFSFIGYESQEVAIAGRSVIDITMLPSLENLAEIVVIGYSEQARKDVTGAVASVDVENMSKRTTADVTQALQGTVTGVRINYTDASPGSAFNFNIRGISSTNGASASPPLVIVDGVQISGLQFVDGENVVGDFDRAGLRQTTGLENINPDDIESIQVLKDASAAAIYGTRAANGVIIITTKRGKIGAPQISYNASVGIQSPFQGPEVANTQEYMQILQSMYGDDLSGGELIPQSALDYLSNPGQFSSYNWYDIVYDDAFIQNHDISVSGGGNYGSYRISAGYKDQDGVALGTGYERVNVRSNTDFIVGDKINIGQSIALSRSKTSPEPFAFSRSVMYKALVMYPHFSPYGINPDPANDPNGPPRNSSFYWGGGDNPEALIRNPLDYQQFWSRSIRQDNAQVSVFGEYEIIPGLTYKLRGTYNQTQATLKTRTRSVSQPEEYFNQQRRIDESETTQSNWTVENILSYNKTFKRHSVNALVGYVAQEFINKSLGGAKADFLSDRTSTLDGPGANPLFTELSGNREESSLNSFISQVFYSFDDRYMVTFNFRRDGSSSFDPSVRWGNFPGISGAWRISNEQFWSSLGLEDVIDEFKLRAGYGVLGRQATDAFPPQANLSFRGYSFGGSVANGLITPGPINQFVTWEESKTTNIGLDFGILNGLFSGSVEYFDRVTDQLITGAVIPASAGGGSIQTNEGRIDNEGIEFELNFHQSIGPVDLNIGLNATYVKTTLTKLPEELIFGEGAPEWDVPHIIQIFRGRSPSEFWLIQTDGIFKTQQEIDAHGAQPDAQPGDIRFIDADGDGQITTEGDRVFAGLGIAPWNAGLNINATYKNFDLTLNFYGNFGSYVYNGPKYLLEQPFGYDNFSPKLLDAFDPVTNPNSDFPRNNPNDIDENWNSNSATDRYLEKGDFVKASLIQVGYNIPTALTSNVGIGSARVYISGQNLFTLSGYDGIDPEQGRDGWFSAGIDRGTAPQFRTLLFGLSVNF